MHHSNEITRTGIAVGNDSSPRSLAGAVVDFTASMAKFAASGFKMVDAASHGIRIGQCRSCEHCRDSQCALCRCFIDKKAWLPHEDCPIGRWPG